MTRIKIIVDIRTIANIKPFEPNISVIFSGELVSHPKTKFAPSIDAARILFMTFAKNEKIFSPIGVLIIKTASKNCNKSPTETVFRFIFFLLFDIK